MWHDNGDGSKDKDGSAATRTATATVHLLPKQQRFLGCTGGDTTRCHLVCELQCWTLL